MKNMWNRYGGGYKTRRAVSVSYLSSISITISTIYSRSWKVLFLSCFATHQSGQWRIHPGPSLLPITILYDLGLDPLLRQSAMSIGSCQVAPGASSSRPGRRAYVQPSILDELRHLDLSGRVSLKEAQVIGVGTYGDVLKSRCTLQTQKEVVVAVKRLRFYLKEDIEAVRPYFHF